MFSIPLKGDISYTLSRKTAGEGMKYYSTSVSLACQQSFVVFGTLFCYVMLPVILLLVGC
jgi:hypothetical protein